MRFPTQLAACLLTFASVRAGAAPQITLKDAAMVRGARVTLADVAELGGVDAAAAPALAAFDLGAAPLPGYTTRLSRAQIERLLRARSLAAGAAWHGAEAVRVERQARGYDGAALVLAAEKALRRQLEGAATRVELQLSGAPPELLLPEGAVELRPRPIAPEQALHRRVTVWVDVAVDGVPARAVAVPFALRAYRPVLVAGRDLPEGSTPQCDSVGVREEDVAALDGVALAADCGALRGRLKRKLAQGTPLLKSHLQAPLAVAQGDSVSLRLSEGAIVLEARATALADGEVGQRIEVRPAAGTALVAAEVVAPGVVKLTGR